MQKTDPEAILEYANHIIKTARWLPDAQRPKRNRRSRGARLFTGIPFVVELTAEALCQHPRLFQDGARKGRMLSLCQRRATAFRVVRDRLLHLADLAQEGYLEEQCAAAEFTLDLLKKVQAEDTPHAFDRQAALALAMCTLALFKPRAGRPAKKVPGKRRRPAPGRKRDEPSLQDMMEAMLAVVTGRKR